MWFKKQTGKTVANVTPAEGTKSYGRQVPLESARKSMRTFIPALAMGVIAALPAHGQQKAERTLQQTLDHSDYTTPAPTAESFYAVNKKEIYNEIAAELSEVISPGYVGYASSSNVEYINRFMKDGHAVAINNNWEDRDFEYDRHCIDISKPAHTDRLDGFEELSQIKHMRLKESVIGSRDYRQFIKDHEHAHCNTPWGFETWVGESMADIYAVANNYQKNGDISFVEDISDLRNIGSLRAKRTSHYTAPALNAAIAILEEKHQSGELQDMSEEELLEFSKSMVIDRSTNTPHAHLAEAVKERNDVHESMGSELRVLSDGNFWGVDDDNLYKYDLGAGDLHPKIQEAADSLAASIDNIYHVADRNLQEDAQLLLLEYEYSDTLTEFVESHEDPALAREGLAYKAWETIKQARDAADGEPPHIKQVGLPPETKLGIIEEVRQEHFPERSPENDHEQTHTPDRS